MASLVRSSSSSSLDSASATPSDSDLRLYALYCFDVLHSKLSHSTPVHHPSTLPHANQEFPLFITWNIAPSSSAGSFNNVRLRGCIGNFDPLRLEKGLGDYAIISAFKDRRFSPIQSREFNRLQCGVSLLTNFETCVSYLDWNLGEHGIYIHLPNPALRPPPITSGDVSERSSYSGKVSRDSEDEDYDEEEEEDDDEEEEDDKMDTTSIRSRATKATIRTSLSLSLEEEAPGGEAEDGESKKAEPSQVISNAGSSDTTTTTGKGRKETSASQSQSKKGGGNNNNKGSSSSSSSGTGTGTRGSGDVTAPNSNTSPSSSSKPGSLLRNHLASRLPFISSSSSKSSSSASSSSPNVSKSSSQSTSTSTTSSSKSKLNNSSTTSNFYSSNPHLPSTLTATYLPDVAPAQGWSKLEAIDSAIRKSGWDGRINEDLRRSLKVTRYRSVKGCVNVKEWKEWRVGEGRGV